ncbi:MAG TPA: DNA-processing protein DprA [Candidatus Paceibacterota bacterium]
MSIRTLTPKDFPESIREIPDAPKILYIRGELPDPNKYSYLTVVGSRRCSNYGREVCQKLIAELAGYPIVIVSGLALGTDANAHEAALATDLKTIAVPGSGIDWEALHPRTNLGLAKRIIEAGGAILSEFEPTAKPQLHMFPQRNRIMAGLSKAVLLIEAGEQSGTLITARLASEYNRELLVVPGSIFSANSKGVHQFLKLGATPVTKSEDILEVLGFKNEDNKAVARNYDDLSPDQKKIVELLSIEPLARDSIIGELDISVSDLNMLLSVMELKGLIKEELGEIRLA